MIFTAALVLGGALVYASNDTAGSLLIAAGCAIEIVRFAARHIWPKQVKFGYSDFIVDSHLRTSHS